MKMTKDVVTLSAENAQQVVHERRMQQLEQKRLEEALHHAQEELFVLWSRYVDLYDFAPVGYVTIGENGLVEEANLTATLLLGVDQLIGKSLSNFVNPEYKNKYDQHIKQAAQTGKRQTSEMILVRSDGSSFQTALESVATKKSEGSEIQVRMMISDMTRCKKAEDDLQRLAALVASSEDAITAVNLDHIFIEWNAASERLFGYRAYEILGRSVSVLLPPNRQTEAQQLFRRARRGDLVVNNTTVWVHKNRQEIQISLTLLPVKNMDGTITHIATLIHNISEMKRIETTLREREKNLQTIVDSAQDGMITIDDQGIVKTFNPRAEQIFGYSEAEIIGRNVNMLMPSEYAKAHDTYLKHYLRMNEKKITGMGREVTGLCKDGTQFPMHLTLCEMPVDNRRVFLGTVRDITVRKRSEQQMLVYQQQLRSLSAQLALTEQQTRRKIATDLHDRIGQTLAVTLLKLGAAKTQASSPELGNAIDDVRTLIDQAYQDTRSMVFEISPPALYEQGLTVALQQLSEEMSQQHGLQIDVIDDGQTKPLKEEFRDFLFRAVCELLVNVIKHAQTNRVTVVVSRVENHVRIEVTDKGTGFQVSVLEMDTHDGFGLFNIKERLNFLGGLFKIESQAWHGTQVLMELPLDLKIETQA